VNPGADAGEGGDSIRSGPGRQRPRRTGEREGRPGQVRTVGCRLVQRKGTLLWIVHGDLHIFMRHLEVVCSGVVVIVAGKGCAVVDVFIAAVRYGFNDAVPPDVQPLWEGKIPARRGKGGSDILRIAGIGVIYP